MTVAVMEGNTMAYENSEYRIAGGLPVNVGMRQCDVAWLSSRMWSGTVVTPFNPELPHWRSLREIVGTAIVGFGSWIVARRGHEMSELHDMDQHELHDLGVTYAPVPSASARYADQFGGC